LVVNDPIPFLIASELRENLEKMFEELGALQWGKDRIASSISWAVLMRGL
jgi:hypothetical protein